MDQINETWKYVTLFHYVFTYVSTVELRGSRTRTLNPNLEQKLKTIAFRGAWNDKKGATPPRTN